MTRTARMRLCVLLELMREQKLRVRFPMRLFDFSIDLIFPAHYGPVVDSASNTNECQESSWGEGKGRPECKDDSLTAMCEPIF
jgi:hypothetical protein